MKNKIIFIISLLTLGLMISCGHQSSPDEQADEQSEQQTLEQPPADQPSNEPMPAEEVKATADNVFDKLDYDRVVAYNYYDAKGANIVDSQGRLAGHVLKQLELTRSQATKITNILCDKNSYGGEMKSCFNPNFGIVYYKGSKIIAHISISLDCNYLNSSIDIIGSGGFSAQGSKKIVEIEQELQLFY